MRFGGSGRGQGGRGGGVAGRWRRVNVQAGHGGRPHVLKQKPEQGHRGTKNPPKKTRQHFTQTETKSETYGGG